MDFFFHVVVRLNDVRDKEGTSALSTLSCTSSANPSGLSDSTTLSWDLIADGELLLECGDPRISAEDSDIGETLEGGLGNVPVGEWPDTCVGNRFSVIVCRPSSFHCVRFNVGFTV